MAWANEKKKVPDASTYREEAHWVSEYANSEDRWVADFKPYYDLVGVYDVDSACVLYRFILDDSRKDELGPYPPKFQNVLIKNKPPKAE